MTQDVFGKNILPSVDLQFLTVMLYCCHTGRKGGFLMKRLLFFTLSLCLLLLAACQSNDAPLLTVKSGEDTITPYEHISSSKSWDAEEKVWTRAEIPKLKLLAIAEELPTLIYANDLRFDHVKQVTVRSISLYDSLRSQNSLGHELSVLETLHAGEYYVVIHAIKQGDYIREEKDYERSGYDFAFRLILPPVETDEPLCQITCGDTTITPYAHPLCSFDGARFDDSPTLVEMLRKGIELPLPTLTWTETAALSLNPNARDKGITVYDPTLEHLHDFSDISKLDSLPTGEYLVTVKVFEYYEYLPDIDRFTYSGYEMGFRLIKN